MQKASFILNVVSDDLEKAIGFLREHKEVSSVTQKNNSIIFEAKNDDNIISNIVQYLVDKQVRLLLPRVDKEDLHDIFMQVTKGKLM